MEAFHLAPHRDIFPGVKGAGIGIAAITVAARGMIIGEGPMHEVGINRLQTQIPQRAGQGQQHISGAMHVVPYLGGDKKRLPLDHPFIEGAAEHLADLCLIPVYLCVVQQPVAGLQRAIDGLGYLIWGIVVGAKGAQADCRDGFTVPKPKAGHRIGSYSRCHGVCSFPAWESSVPSNTTATLPQWPEAISA